MGVTGAGKSTMAGILAGQLGWDLAEGDDLHPAANVAKMSAGTPLTDEDRWPWLDRVAAWIRDHTATGMPGIITCSALKRSYRDRLSGNNVVFVHLTGSKDLMRGWGRRAGGAGIIDVLESPEHAPRNICLRRHVVNTEIVECFEYWVVERHCRQLLKVVITGGVRTRS